MKLTIISGLSGSGKSVALHTLEDLGYYCIDNLPAGLLEAFAQNMVRSHGDQCKAAVGIDARNQPQDLKDFPQTLQRLRESGTDICIVFLRADNNSLLQRFSETRRPHPLGRDGMSLADAIALEHKLLEPLSSSADIYIDTTRTNVHELRDLVRDRVAGGGPSGLSMMLQSFGYKHGIPTDADFVFDVRCLPNPHWDPRLRPLTGLDPAVSNYLADDALVGAMRDDLAAFLDKWIPRFIDDSRSYMSIAIGCTGGQHRSVYMVEHLATHLRDQHREVLVRHRELP